MLRGTYTRTKKQLNEKVYNSSLHTMDQSNTFRVNILLMLAKSFGPAWVNLKHSDYPVIVILVLRGLN